jgi:hypothetical protein
LSPDLNNIVAKIDKLIHEERYNDALFLLYYISIDDPSLEAGYYAYLIGKCYEETNNITGARFWYKRAVEENPEVTQYSSALDRTEEMDIESMIFLRL